MSRLLAERMARYDRELAYEVRTGSPEGRRVERAVAEYYRSDLPNNRELIAQKQAELRALATGGGSTASASGGGGAALVSPYFVWEACAPFRGIHRTFADQCGTATLPAWGLELYIPAFTSTTGTGQQTEGQTVRRRTRAPGYRMRRSRPLPARS
jgi:hypothetical protein